MCRRGQEEFRCRGVLKFTKARRGHRALCRDEASSELLRSLRRSQDGDTATAAGYSECRSVPQSRSKLGSLEFGFGLDEVSFTFHPKGSAGCTWVFDSLILWTPS